jgi:hypothetical protein
VLEAADHERVVLVKDALQMRLIEEIGDSL